MQTFQVKKGLRAIVSPAASVSCFPTVPFSIHTCLSFPWLLDLLAVSQKGPAARSNTALVAFDETVTTSCTKSLLLPSSPITSNTASWPVQDTEDLFNFPDTSIVKTGPHT